jgi:P4 family phage/plasmid primase-like protien
VSVNTDQLAATMPKTEPDNVVVSPNQLTEYDYANLLAAKLPPIRTVEQSWYVYESGAWQEISRASLLPEAQAMLPPAIRTARRATTLLDHLEGRFQVPARILRGFYAFDGQAILVNCSNGAVRIEADAQLQLTPSSPDFLFTRKTAANFRREASAQLFERILAEALPDQEDRDLLQLCCGNFLLPDCRFETALVCYGEAERGKSTIAEPIAAALGTGLVERLSMSQICDPRSYSLPKLRFAAVNLGTELDAIAVDESANFKTIVSGEPVEARPIYGSPFTMQTACKLWFLANGLPRFKNGTQAELRRTRFIRFDRRPAQKDVTLKARLLEEVDGVFNFMLVGLQRLLTLSEIPLGGPESRQVHERFRISNDPIGAFVRERCEFDPAVQVSKECLGNAYQEFCERNELPQEFGEWFFRRIRERYPSLKDYRPNTGERARFIKGVRLRSMITPD